MENIKRLIIENNLIKEGEVIGVGVSGGKDSMALLHYLNNLSRELDFEVVAITIDHGIRENGASDALFVMDYCRKNRIRAYKFRIDSYAISKEKSISLESAAREGRFGVFETMLNKNIVDKIALAHHLSDQAETVLMHLLRGSGITGLKGMSLVRDGVYIRPMLETNEKAIWQYICENDIPIVEDETNVITRWSTAKASGIASVETAVRELHPEWNEEQIVSEVTKIKFENNIGIEDPTLLQMDFENENID